MLKRFSSALLAATAIGLIAGGGALAADLRMPVKAAPAPLPPPVQDWSGIYVGVEGGYGWGKQSESGNVPFLFVPRRDQLRCNGGGQRPQTCGSGAGTLSQSHFNDFLEDFFEVNNGSAGAGIGGVSNSGWLAGFFWGAQKQYGNWVLGFDADIEGADIKGTSTSNVRTSNAVFVPPNFEDDITQLNHSAALEAKIDLLGRFVGKIGWAWSPNWMIYGTGGMAYAHVKDSLADVQNVVFGTLCDVPDGTTDPNQCDHVRSATNSIIASANQSMFGWTIGAGIDYKWQIDPGSAVVLGVDYRFYDFPTQTFTFSDPNTGFSTGFSSKQTINVVQARISYLFSIH